MSKPQIIRAAGPIRPPLSFLEQKSLLLEGLRRCGAPITDPDRLAGDALSFVLRPNDLEKALEEGLAKGALPSARRVRVLGPVDARVVLLTGGRSDEYVAVSLGPPLAEIPFPVGGPATFELDSPGERISGAAASREFIARLDEPHVKIIALYHPENFPLPRFALGISDLARSVRKQMIGRVSLCDMQLNVPLAKVEEEILAERPDILGISATFGQDDILQALMGAINAVPDYDPLVVFGGSLAALNARQLVEAGALVAGGAGEGTIRDVVRYYSGDCRLEDIQDVWYSDEQGVVRRTRRTNNRAQDDILPELDLAEPTLDVGGVVQLESSRGCSYACSFCPREHKGVWTGDAPHALETVLPHLAGLYDERPQISRKIFLVDEEFFGYRQEEEVLARVNGVARTLGRYGFRFETSSRVDQVCRMQRDRDWHVSRIAAWRNLVASGLDRCLFGVESGVDSILKRFNKKTCSEQNALAIRTLSASGVPMRCTYITFDQLMTMDELLATYRFQGRDDLVLRRLPVCSPTELHDGVRTDDFVREHKRGVPFYTEITYMLVSMECLIGSPYLAEVERMGLAGPFNMNMGRRDARFVDPTIGIMSYLSQSWIDRNFSLDYTLKSIEKIAREDERKAARQLRLIIKRKSYELLGIMLAVAHGDESLFADTLPLASRRKMSRLFSSWSADHAQQTHLLTQVLEHQFHALTSDIAAPIADLASLIQRNFADLLMQEFDRWVHRTGWEHINAA